MMILSVHLVFLPQNAPVDVVVSEPAARLLAQHQPRACLAGHCVPSCQLNPTQHEVFGCLLVEKIISEQG